MARMESKAKSGFYPTPDRVLKLLKSKLIITQDARLCDPCCGEGSALAALAEGTPGVTYGIEIDHTRTQIAKTMLNYVCWADALCEMRITGKMFGLLWLNPPYDFEVNPEQKSERLEKKFLKKFFPSLQSGGWLVFLIPYNIVGKCADIIAGNFKNIGVFSFHEPEFQTFRQCVVVGQRAVGIRKSVKIKKQLQQISEMEPDVFKTACPGLNSMPEMSIPAPLKGVIQFKSLILDPVDATEFAEKGGLLTQVVEMLKPRKLMEIRPLRPLEKGHLALMLASGFMNGKVSSGDKTLLIKGQIVNNIRLVNCEVDDDEKHQDITIRNVYQPTIKAIDLESAQLFIIQ